MPKIGRDTGPGGAWPSDSPTKERSESLAPSRSAAKKLAKAAGTPPLALTNAATNNCREARDGGRREDGEEVEKHKKKDKKKKHKSSSDGETAPSPPNKKLRSDTADNELLRSVDSDAKARDTAATPKAAGVT